MRKWDGIELHDQAMRELEIMRLLTAIADSLKPVDVAPPVDLVKPIAPKATKKKT